ncbi:GNAT family N-acetyltransferase [Lysinibacter sp. HNR]|uniref:GNAT family N-acetyltransferase n=1 Tax=Lysinibacter sp. HNR TaxID=3031408 RepID=UPI002435332F|nr:GNAT family N-acetyltransferase [Lysinibacter sp. HNR]WGD37103.1 GNAT family N-acetyltransferase [Lysinibacter sp. HNR]
MSSMIDYGEYAVTARDGSPLTLRLVRPDEYEKLADFCEEAYAHDYPIGDEYRQVIRGVAARAQTSLVWVAERSETGEIVASVTTPHPGKNISELGRPGELDLRLLAVSPRTRGEGIGELLTRFVIDLARERGDSRVVLNSGATMLGAHRLYEKIGFTRVRERETEFLNGEGELIYLLVYSYDLSEVPRAWAAPGD